MNQMSAPATASPLRAAPLHFVTDTHGARYESVSEGHIQLVDAAGRHGRVVVGVDGSEASVEALRRGILMATALNAFVEAVASWRTSAAYGNYAEMEYSPAEDAHAILSGAVKSVFGANVPDWFTASIHEGNADDVLIEQSTGAEMLVVGSRGHGGIAGVLLGSVSAMCAEHAHCPVLIVH